MGIRITSSDFAELTRDIAEARAELPRDLRQVISKAALNIKNDWRARWAEHRTHLPHIARAINYDVGPPGLVVEAEIGVDKGRIQGPLANFLEFGSVNNSPQPGGKPALDDEAPRLERAAADLLERLLARRQ